jgi:cell division protease FtsH
MVVYYGMSDKLSNISYFDSSRAEYSFTKPYSEKTAELIDKEVKAIVDEQYNRAKDLINSHREQHKELADLLVEKEVIFADDVERIFGKRPWTSRQEELSRENKKEVENTTEETAIVEDIQNQDNNE